MSGIIDFHAHAFPDSLAEQAISALEKEGGIPARLDGKLSSLLDSMDSCGIEKSVVCSIATRPTHFKSILEWSGKIRSGRIIPLPSVHPADPDAVGKIGIIKREGFSGIKMHPYYQDFKMDEARMFPIYEKASSENLLLVMHTGFDFAFERVRKADPERILKITSLFPSLRLILTHLGAWEDWEMVEELVAGKRIYMEISFSLEFMEKRKAAAILLKHPEDLVLFGTDSPWTSQENTLRLFRELALGDRLEKMVLRENALSLLGLAGG